MFYPEKYEKGTIEFIVGEIEYGRKQYNGSDIEKVEGQLADRSVESLQAFVRSFLEKAPAQFQIAFYITRTHQTYSCSNQRKDVLLAVCTKTADMKKANLHSVEMASHWYLARWCLMIADWLRNKAISVQYDRKRKAEWSERQFKDTVENLGESVAVAIPSVPRAVKKALLNESARIRKSK